MIDLGLHKRAFNRVGWFIPPYLGLGFLTMLRNAIDSGKPFEQTHLEAALAIAYSPEGLAAMVCERYPATPHVSKYARVIAESVEAHFGGLRHVAALGLMPVIEGAGRELADSRAVKVSTMSSLFPKLARDCKDEVISKGIGSSGEIIAMFESFEEFVGNFLYIQSDAYPLDDNTNRHGIVHGAYADNDYGEPINFYKAIGAVDFLCMVSALRAPISWLAPDPTPASNRLAKYYRACSVLADERPG